MRRCAARVAREHAVVLQGQVNYQRARPTQPHHARIPQPIGMSAITPTGWNAAC